MNSNKYRYCDLLGENFKINYDIKIDVASKHFQFYFWVNLWYACLDSISSFIIENMLENKKCNTINYDLDTFNRVNNTFICLF